MRCVSVPDDGGVWDMSQPWVHAVGEIQFGTGALTVTWPAHTTNDVGILLVESANETVATPTDWTALTPQGSGTAGAAGSTAIYPFWRRAAGAGTASASVTDPGDHAVAQIVVIRNALSTASPIDVEGGDTSTTSTSVTIPAVTTTVANALVLFGVANGLDQNTNSISAVPGFTNANLDGLVRRDGFMGGFQAGSKLLQDSSGVGGGFAWGTGLKATAATTGTTTATLLATSIQARYIVAIKPEPAAAGGGGGPLVITD